MSEADRVLARKRAAERLGRQSELWAALLLMCKGYRILARRVRTPLGEIDLVARAPSGIVCVVEVKARNSEDAAHTALRPRQQLRIAQAAQLYLAKRPGWAAKGLRFDTVILAPRTWPKHIRDAWRPDRG